MPQLALEGGEPVRRQPFPTVENASGRTLGDEELRLLEEVIRSGILNRVGGKQARLFEEEFAQFHNAAFAVGTTSGTSAIHVAVGALDPEPGDEIIVAPISDMGSVIPILYQNALPVFADVDPRTGNISAETIASCLSERTRAVIVVHLFGRPAEMDPILELCRSYGITVIEDCAQAIGAEYKGQKVGTLGDFGCFSFQQSKHITTGDGGMVLVNRPEYQTRARLFSDKGWPREGTTRDYLFLAPNYRMNELTAAVGRAQLRKLPEVVERRKAIAEALSQGLEQIPGLIPPYVPPHTRPSWWLYPFHVDQEVLGIPPSEFARYLRAEGIPVSAGYIGKPLFCYEMLYHRRTYGRSEFPFSSSYCSRPIIYGEQDCPGAWEALQSLLLIPINERYTEQEVKDILSACQKIVEKFFGRIKQKAEEQG